jgi:hypothetical protein
MAILGASGAVQGADHRDRRRRPDRPLAWKPLIIISGGGLFGWTCPMGMVLALPMLLIVVASLAGDEFHWKDALLNCRVLTVGSGWSSSRAGSDDPAVAPFLAR